MLRCGYCSALISEFAMNDLIDRILNTYQLMRPLDADRVSDSRQKITRYIESLASAGQSDASSWSMGWHRAAREARSSVYRVLAASVGILQGDERWEELPSSHPLTASGAASVAGGCVHAHLREVFLGGTTKAPFFDHRDRRINLNKNQTDN